jgi:hypothetical protein
VVVVVVAVAVKAVLAAISSTMKSMAVSMRHSLRKLSHAISVLVFHSVSSLAILTSIHGCWRQ